MPGEPALGRGRQKLRAGPEPQKPGESGRTATVAPNRSCRRRAPGPAPERLQPYASPRSRNLSRVELRSSSVAGRPGTGASRTTGRPCRVRTTSSPASARRTRSVRRALASLIGTFIACRTPRRGWPRRKSWSGPGAKSSLLAKVRPRPARVILAGQEAQPRWPAPRALPRRSSPSAHWSRGGARTRCFRLLPCVQER